MPLLCVPRIFMCMVYSQCSTNCVKHYELEIGVISRQSIQTLLCFLFQIPPCGVLDKGTGATQGYGVKGHLDELQSDILIRGN